jgi:hypothetical protein
VCKLRVDTLAIWSAVPFCPEPIVWESLFESISKPFGCIGAFLPPNRCKFCSVVRENFDIFWDIINRGGGLVGCVLFVADFLPYRSFLIDQRVWRLGINNWGFLSRCVCSGTFWSLPEWRA